MEVGDDSAPMSRARCNTWHAGLGEEASVTSEQSFLLAARSGGAGVKQRPARRNAWGAASYADLIAAAIESSPDKRLTLAQIYDWMVTNVKYFSDRADSSSSAGWKNSIRHNLSLHRRFVRVPHRDGKSSWWTVNPSEPSVVRWPRGSGTGRHRADSMDTRSFALQRQRRSRKSASGSSVDSIRKSHTSTVPLSSSCFETVEEAKLDSLKLFSGQDFYTSSSDNAVFPSTVVSDSLYNMDDTFSTRLLFSDINSGLSPRPSAFLDTDDQVENTAVELTSFHSKASPVLEPTFESSALVEDEYSNVMVTQLSPLAWNQLEMGAIDLVTDIAAVAEPENHNLPLFSDDSMLTASHLTDSSQEEPVFCDDRELVLAAYSTVSSPSDQPSFRRGSDAPPPSPESNCGEASSSFDETVSNLAEMKVEASVAASGSTGQFATGWTSAFPLKTDDLSSLSDVDMEH